MSFLIDSVVPGFVLRALADGPYCLTENLDRSSPWPGQSTGWTKLHATFWEHGNRFSSLP